MVQISNYSNNNISNKANLANQNALQQQPDIALNDLHATDIENAAQQVDEIQVFLKQKQNEAQSILSQNQRDSLSSLANKLDRLTAETKTEVLQDLINSAHTEINDYLTDKSLTSADITRGKNITEGLNLADDMLQSQPSEITSDTVDTDTSDSASGTMNATQSNVDDVAGTVGMGANSFYANNNFGNNNVGVAPSSGVPVITYDNAQQLLDSNIFANCDPIMRSAMILLLFINTTMSNTMNNYDNQFISLTNNMNTLSGATGAQNYMQEVAAYMAANPDANINVFAALALFMNGEDDPDLGNIGIDESNIAYYQQFLQSCPGFIGGLQGAFEAYQGNGGTESIDQIACGDGTYVSPVVWPPVGEQTFTGQSEVMQYFTQPYNEAGYNISGLGSNPIFGDSWTDPTTANAANSPFTNNTATSGGKPLPLANGASALTFNMTTVAGTIGSSGGENNNTNTILGGINQAMTTASTSSNTLQSQINAVSNAINVIYTTIGSNLIPNTKIQF